MFLSKLVASSSADASLFRHFFSLFTTLNAIPPSVPFFVRRENYSLVQQYHHRWVKDHLKTLCQINVLSLTLFLYIIFTLHRSLSVNLDGSLSPSRPYITTTSYYYGEVIVLPLWRICLLTWWLEYAITTAGLHYGRQITELASLSQHNTKRHTTERCVCVCALIFKEYEVWSLAHSNLLG
jgi:hypothetical protein